MKSSVVFPYFRGVFPKTSLGGHILSRIANVHDRFKSLSNDLMVYGHSFDDKNTEAYKIL